MYIWLQTCQAAFPFCECTDRRKAHPGVLSASSHWPAAQHPRPCHGGLQRAWAQPCHSPAPSRTATNHFWPMPADVEIKHAGRVDGSRSHTLWDAEQSPAALRMSEEASHGSPSPFTSPRQSQCNPTDRPQTSLQAGPVQNQPTYLLPWPRLPLSYTSAGKQGISPMLPPFYISNDLSFRYIHK